MRNSIFYYFYWENIKKKNIFIPVWLPTKCYIVHEKIYFKKKKLFPSEKINLWHRFVHQFVKKFYIAVTLLYYVYSYLYFIFYLFIEITIFATIFNSKKLLFWGKKKSQTIFYLVHSLTEIHSYYAWPHDHFTSSWNITTDKDHSRPWPFFVSQIGFQFRNKYWKTQETIMKTPWNQVETIKMSSQFILPLVWNVLATEFFINIYVLIVGNNEKIIRSNLEFHRVEFCRRFLFFWWTRTLLNWPRSRKQ